MGNKRKIMIGLVVFCGIFFFGQHQVKGVITDVSILPEAPTFNDDITINVFGVEGSGPVLFTDSIFVKDGTSLELDLYITVGPFLSITNWSYSEDIGILSDGMYDITVNSIFELEPFLNNTFITSFEVIPEPSSLLFLMSGVFGVRRRRRKRSC